MNFIRKRQLSATLPKIYIVFPIKTIWKFGRCLLASSHAGTRLPIAEIHNSGSSPSVSHICGYSFPPFSRVQKTGDTFWMPPVKNLYYDFLRRHYPHQVKGRSLITSSQPAFTSSPVFYQYSTKMTHMSIPKQT